MLLYVFIVVSLWITRTDREDWITKSRNVVCFGPTDFFFFSWLSILHIAKQQRESERKNRLQWREGEKERCAWWNLHTWSMCKLVRGRLFDLWRMAWREKQIEDKSVLHTHRYTCPHVRKVFVFLAHHGNHHIVESSLFNRSHTDTLLLGVLLIPWYQVYKK